MSRDELVERFSLDRVGASPATFDYQKLDWMNGVYLRALSPDEFAERLVAYLRERRIDWDTDLVRRAAPLVQEKIETLGRFPEFARFLFEPVDTVDGFDDVGTRMLERSARALADVEPFEAEPIEHALRATADELGLKPRQAFQPIRVAVTGSTVSPGLFESLELLGRDESLERLKRAAGAGA
jgi:glutamyl-tRNA synthetase